MGLFDFLFGKKDKPTETDTSNMKVKTASSRGHIATKKAEVTLENYEDICKNYIAFDTETTGLSPESDVIIELGAVKFINGKAGESYGSIVNEGQPVPDAAFRVNHISTEMVRSQGKAPEVAYKELIDFLGEVLDGRICICAHNASFDIAFLKNTLERLGYSGNLVYIDTLTLSRRMIKGLPNYKQETVAEFFEIKNKNAHRAASDAATCGEIFSRLLELKNDEIEKEKARVAKSKPTDEEKEVFAIIAESMRKNGCCTHNLRAYRNSSNYVDVLDVYTVLKYKLGKKKSYIVLPGTYADGLEKVEECTNTEGKSNVRLLFDDPFELAGYGQLFSRIYSEMKESQGIYMNQYEAEFLAQANLTGFTDRELEEYLEKAKERQLLKSQLREKEIQRDLEQVAEANAKKEEKARIREAEKKKKEAAAASIIEQRELVKKLCDCRDDITIEDVIRISKLSSDMGKRAVLQLDDEGGIVKIYESISEASKAIGIAPKTIRDVANGKYKHGGGFCWKYADQLTDE